MNHDRSKNTKVLAGLQLGIHAPFRASDQASRFPPFYRQAGRRAACFDIRCIEA
jgi:hypothetical protein